MKDLIEFNEIKDSSSAATSLCKRNTKQLRLRGKPFSNNTISFARCARLKLIELLLFLRRAAQFMNEMFD